VRHLGTIPVWSTTKPDAADVLGISRSQAYGLARTGEIPTLRLGKGRVVVPVPALLVMLGDRLSPTA
jgi:predicted site-specific integrase-resolvase